MSVWAPAVVLILALSHSTHWPETFLEGSFPVKIVRKYADEMVASRIYTSDKWAGYLIYANYPRQRVFFDDRHHYYGDAIIQDYVNLGGVHSEWRELLERYRFNLVLCTPHSALP